MSEQKYFYIVLLLTPYNTGKFIRFVTKYPYNHSGISLSPKMKYFYSFSRHYKGAPFYAGFTKESILRYRHKGETATMKICAVPVDEKQYSAAEERFEYLLGHSGEYIYNLISAACFPFRKTVKIEKAFTCVEFVLGMLREYANVPGLEKTGFCSIKELSELLDKFTVYEGSAEKFFEDAGWEGDTFPEEKGNWFYLKKTVSNNAELVRRFFKKK